MTPKESVLSAVEDPNGVRIATASGGHGGTEVLFVHATGLCKEIWDPVIAAMRTEPLSWQSMDLRGHGDSSTGPFPNHWDLVGRDVRAVVGERTDVVGVGHSVGGAAVARAAVASPGMFRHLVLIEPIIFPTPTQRLEGPMSLVARKRRRLFESRASAGERFMRGPFRHWTAEAMDAYLDGGFRQTDRGFELKCTPEVEADFFMEGSNHDTWDIVGEIDIPVTIVAGDRSTTHIEPYLGALVARFGEVELVVLDDATHLMPMEDPTRVAELIDDVISLASS